MQRKKKKKNSTTISTRTECRMNVLKSRPCRPAIGTNFATKKTYTQGVWVGGSSKLSCGTAFTKVRSV